MRAGEICFTEVIRDENNKCEDYMHVPPIELAFWFMDNWWRLFHETAFTIAYKSNPNWRLAHEISAIGGGFIWPRICIWGQKPFICIESCSDSYTHNFGLRYTKDAVVNVLAKQFESEVDKFLEQAINAKSYAKDALCAQFEELKEERNNLDIAHWRRLEAGMGYDAGCGPDDLIERFERKHFSFLSDLSEENWIVRKPSSPIDLLDAKQDRPTIPANGARIPKVYHRK